MERRIKREQSGKKDETTCKLRKWVETISKRKGRGKLRQLGRDKQCAKRMGRDCKSQKKERELGRDKL